jgi:hypothetical protein
MSIIQCPRCKTNMTAGESAVEFAVLCPSCGIQLKVPATVAQPAGPPAIGKLLPSAAAPPAPLADFDSPRSTLKRRRAMRWQSGLMAAIGGALAVVALAGVACFAFRDQLVRAISDEPVEGTVSKQSAAQTPLPQPHNRSDAQVNAPVPQHEIDPDAQVNARTVGKSMKTVQKKPSVQKEDQEDRELKELVDEVIGKVAWFMPTASDSDLDKVAAGNLSPVFPTTSPNKVRPLSVAQISTQMRLIQRLPDGILVHAGGRVTFFLMSDRAATIRAARTGVVIPNELGDRVYLVFRAKEYATVSGGTNIAVPIVLARDIIDRARIAEIVEQERRARRDKNAAEQKRQAEATAAAAAKQRATDTEDALKRLRHTFSDTSNTHHVDAVVVRIEPESVQLVRLDNQTELKIPRSEISASDMKWLADHATYIRKHGPLLGDYFREQREKR